MSRKPKRVYVSGPIAGHPGARTLFSAAALQLRMESRYAVDVVNPFAVEPVPHEGECPPGYEADGEHLSSCYMRADLKALLDCDAIAMLPGWKESRGATVEHHVAVACGMEVIEL